MERKKIKGILKVKEKVKIISYGQCNIYLFKNRSVDYWYCRVYNDNYHILSNTDYIGDITEKFADLAPYYEYTHKLIIYHDMVLKMICNRAKKIDDKYNDTYKYYDEKEKPKKKRRLKL